MEENIRLTDNRFDRCPKIEFVVAVILIIIAGAVAISVFGCGPADTGSRHTGLPYNAFAVRSITVVPPADSKPHEIRWIRETLRDHLLLLDAIPIATALKFRLRVYRTKRAWQEAHLALGSVPIVWDPPLVMRSPTVFVGPVAQAFLSGVNGSATLHVIGGTFGRFEGNSLGHHLLHVHLPALGKIKHIPGEVLWAKLDLADWLLSNRLALQR